VTSLPDWLVERVALDEVPPASRERVQRADSQQLAERIAALRADNAAELAAHPAAPAVALIEDRIAAERRALSRARRLRWLGMLSAATAAGVAVIILVGARTDRGLAPTAVPDEIVRVKGVARLLAFRQDGEHAVRLEQDALVRGGDTVQLRYNAGGRRYGVIASLDGAGVVTLHYPASDAAAPEATALAPRLTALPHAYQLDDAPRFERFFFITADAPIDVQQSVAALRALAARSDSSTAQLELPATLHQWSLRLRKPERQTP
jgi:hypothetical protein